MLEGKLRELGEMPCPGVYLVLLELAETIGTKLLDGKTAQDGTIDHGAAESGVRFLAAACQIAHEASGKGIACAGGVVGLFQRKCRNAKDAIFVDQHGAVFAALHDQGRRTHFKDVPGGAEKIVFVGKLTGLRIVDDENVDVLERLAKFLGSALDPVVHGVERDDLGALFHLLEHTALQVGRDVSQKNI